MRQFSVSMLASLLLGVTCMAMDESTHFNGNSTQIKENAPKRTYVCVEHNREF